MQPHNKSEAGIRRGVWLFLIGLIVISGIVVALVRRGGTTVPDGAVNLKISGTKIALPTGWEPLRQPKTFFVQERARHPERAMALSAGAFKLDLPLEQFVALSLLGMSTGSDNQLQALAKMIDVPVSEFERALQSQVGRQTMDQLKQDWNLITFKVLNAGRIEIGGKPAFEIHVQGTVRQSGSVIYSRQFVYSGKAANEIVLIGYASPSDDLFSDAELLNSIHRL